MAGLRARQPRRPGAEPEQFFLSNFSPKLMDKSGVGQPYPYRDSTPAWDGKDPNCLHD